MFSGDRLSGQPQQGCVEDDFDLDASGAMIITGGVAPNR